MVKVGVILGHDFDNIFYDPTGHCIVPTFYTRKYGHPNYTDERFVVPGKSVVAIERTPRENPEFLSEHKGNIYFARTRGVDALVSVHTAIAICDGCDPDLGLVSGLDYGTLGADATFSEGKFQYRANMNPPFSRDLLARARELSDKFVAEKAEEKSSCSVLKYGVYYDWATPEIPPENVLLRLRGQVEGLRYFGSSGLAKEAILAREMGIPYFPIVAVKGLFNVQGWDVKQNFDPNLALEFVRRFISELPDDYRDPGAEVSKEELERARRFL